MIQDFFKGSFNKNMHLKLFKQLLAGCISLCLIIYAAVRIIFFDIKILPSEEIELIGKMLLTGILFAAGISTMFLIADAIQAAVDKMSRLNKLTITKVAVAALVLTLVLFSACNAQVPSAGTVTNKTTGLTAVYKNMKPSKVLLVMNNEVLNHTDIPMGESFLIVNNGIDGLTVKKGKVSVGCALTIKDKKGKTMLQSDDLFNGNDVFLKERATYLKCTVSTGKPMEWEGKYDITVIFWDKYGSGEIVNKVTIRCIDIP